METVVSSGVESDDTVRILKDIRDEIRNARNELRDEIRGVRTERVDPPDQARKTRAAMVVLGFGVAALTAALLIGRDGGKSVERTVDKSGAKTGEKKAGGEIVAVGAPASLRDPPIPAPPPPVVAASATALSAPARVTVPAAAEPQETALAAPKRAHMRHKARPPTEAELEEPAKL
jgi:hypothetical protein